MHRHITCFVAAFLLVTSQLLPECMALPNSVPTTAGSPQRPSGAGPNASGSLNNSSTSSRFATVNASSNSSGSHIGAFQRVPINLDLSSTNSTVRAGNVFQNQVIDITVGTSKLAVNAQTLLTPSEMVAAWQMLRTGQQSLVVDAQGSADAGTMNIGSRISGRLSTLVIPQGVTVTDNARNGSLFVRGSLNDSGSLLLTSQNPAGFSIYAGSVNVVPGGLISNVLPQAAILSSSQSTSSTNSAASLSLIAKNSINNAGQIVSGGTLSLSAGAGITNSIEQGAGVANAKPAISASQSISLLSQNGQIINNGLISSTNGSINISTGDDVDLQVSASGGVFQATNGDINVRQSQYNGINAINLSGGDYLSQNLNLFSGQGSVTTDVGLLTGKVNVYAGSAHIIADTPDLKMGIFHVSGDPLVANPGGDLDISTAGANDTFLVGIAAGSIYTSTPYGIETGSSGTSGGEIVLAAGVTAQPGVINNVTLPELNNVILPVILTGLTELR
jgi:hypothetical protein